jgi:hypothetical protein
MRGPDLAARRSVGDADLPAAAPARRAVQFMKYLDLSEVTVVAMTPRWLDSGRLGRSGGGLLADRPRGVDRLRWLRALSVAA